MLKLAPTLLVEKVEPSLKFFVEVLGFKKFTEVPGDDGLIFAMLTSGSVEIHIQTRDSAAKEVPYFEKASFPPSSFLYIDVKDAQKLYDKLQGKAEILVPIEKTFYGATHFFLKEPGGHVIGFTQNK